MKLSTMLDASVILIITFILLKQKLHSLENIFIFFILEFVITSYCAILYINLKKWGIADNIELFIIFRVYEVIILPILFLLYFNIIHRINQLLKCMITVFFIGILYLMEWWVRMWDVITYNNWHFWESLIVEVFILFLVSSLLRLFRNQLQKEGIKI